VCLILHQYYNCIGLTLQFCYRIMYFANRYYFFWRLWCVFAAIWKNCCWILVEYMTKIYTYVWFNFIEPKPCPGFVILFKKAMLLKMFRICKELLMLIKLFGEFYKQLPETNWQIVKQQQQYMCICFFDTPNQCSCSLIIGLILRFISFNVIHMVLPNPDCIYRSHSSINICHSQSYVVGVSNVFSLSKGHNYHFNQGHTCNQSN